MLINLVTAAISERIENYVVYKEYNSFELQSLLLKRSSKRKIIIM